MSPLRLSLGRALSPIPRPHFAITRDLRLRGPRPVRFPRTEELVLRPPPGTEQLTPGLIVEEMGFEAHGLEPVEVSSLDGQLLAPGWTFHRPDKWDLAPIESLDIPQPEEAPSAPPRLAGLDQAGEAWAFLKLRPRLAPPLAAEEDMVEEEGPSPLLAHQLQAAQVLLGKGSLVLADDYGTGRMAAVAAGLRAAFRQGIARRALLVTAPARLRLWAAELRSRSPELVSIVVPADREAARRAWETQAHIYAVRADELEAWLGKPEAPLRPGDFDLVVLDHAVAFLHRRARLFQTLTDLQAHRRWALAGGLPRQTEDWRSLFGFVTPAEPLPGPGDTAPDLAKRFAAYILRRSKAELKAELPPRSRSEIWLDLDPAEMKIYQETMAEERHRLRQLGEALSRTHVEAALRELVVAGTFATQRLDGIRVRALVDILEEITAGGSKVVVFSQYRDRVLRQITPAIEAFGAMSLEASTSDVQRAQILDAFRRQADKQILLADLEARSDGGVMPASYVIHVDVGWNAARRLRAELRFFPEIRPQLPLTIYEFWTAGTHEVELHELLAEKHLLSSFLPHGTQPADLEGRISLQEWLERVFDITEEVRREPEPEEQVTTTSLLPATTTLRAVLETLSDEQLLEAVGELMDAFGFPEWERADTVREGALDLVARRQADEEIETVLARILRTEKNVGVAEGRALLEDLEARPDALGAYLVTTADFTSACKGLAEESEGRLALVAGPELYRHLHILGWF